LVYSFKCAFGWFLASNDYKEKAELCDWFEEFERKKEEMNFSEGVYNLEDLRDYGR